MREKALEKGCLTPGHTAGEGGRGATAPAASSAPVLPQQSDAWQGHAQQSSAFGNVVPAAAQTAARNPEQREHRGATGQQGAGISAGAGLLLHGAGQAPCCCGQGHLRHLGFNCAKSACAECCHPSSLFPLWAGGQSRSISACTEDRTNISGSCGADRMVLAAPGAPHPPPPLLPLA